MTAPRTRPKPKRRAAPPAAARRVGRPLHGRPGRPRSRGLQGRPASGCSACSSRSGRCSGGVALLRHRSASRCAVIGPKILGQATDLIFAGVDRQASSRPGSRKAQAVAAPARPRPAATTRPTCSPRSTSTPGQGIDFTARRHRAALGAGHLRRRLALRHRPGPAGRTGRAAGPSRGCARDVEAKLSRLPLSYFDQQPRGEVLSRVTNDIDNIAQTLQQTFAQLVTSLLTIVGVLAMMFWISWLLALIALIIGAALGVRRGAASASGPSRSSSRSGRPPAS